MYRVQEKVFDNQLEALRYNRKHSAMFFTAKIPPRGEDQEKTVYIVAISLHRAQIALVDYLMDITKLSKKQQDEAYIKELEATSEGDSE